MVYSILLLLEKYIPNKANDESYNNSSFFRTSATVFTNDDISHAGIVKLTRFFEIINQTWHNIIYFILNVTLLIDIIIYNFKNGGTSKNTIMVHIIWWKIVSRTWLFSTKVWYLRVLVVIHDDKLSRVF